jgi:predicted ester cyclase
MALEEFKDKYRGAVEEAYYKGNVDAMDKLYVPDVIIHQPPFPDINGLGAYKQHILDARQAYTDIHFEWEEMIGEGNTMAFRSSWHMKHTGVSQKIPVPPTGQEVVMKGCFFVHLKGDRIIEVFEYKEYLGFLQRLGVIQPLRF